MSGYRPLEELNVLQKIRSATAAAVLGWAALVSAPNASAAVIAGSWDPTLVSLGASQFNGLGWTATINVSVDDSCVRSDGSSPVIANRTIRIFGTRFDCANPIPILDLAGSPFSILRTQLAFYSLNSGIIQDVFNLTGLTAQFLKLGVDSEILFLSSSTDSNPFSYLDYDFRLSLPGLAPQLRYRAGTTGSFNTATDPITDTQFISYDNATDALRLSELKKGDLVFGAVPEPGSLALVGLALATAGLAASRRSNRAV